ncbi:MAG TPA: hypothetical protein VN253_24485, partial [Kofleriaceae bacterium]|nr:hypothetical protein [Kofleriaceae bacterium]
MARWFTIALGLVGWGVVLGLPALGVIETGHTPASWTALFMLVILAIRALAFRPVEGSVLSLDSAYYVAAALCVGPVNAGRLTAAALTLDAAVRLYRAPGRGRQLDEPGYVLYFGGMSGGVVAVCGWLFGADPAGGIPVDPTDVALHVIGIGGA